jgi:TolA protein
MKLGQKKGRAFPYDHPDRRLIGGLLVSLLLHGLVLLLQFGAAGLGAPGAPPLTVRIAAVQSPPPAPLPEPDAASPTPPPPLAPRPVSGMRVVDPVSAPPPVKATPLLKKDKPRRARRISPPLPAHETLVEASRVITQDSTLNEFTVPLARPEEAEQKTVDIKQAQQGADDGEGADNAALEAAAAKAGKLKAEAEAQATKLAQETREAARQEALLAEQKKADEQRRDTEQAALQLQKTEQEAARLKEQQLALQKAEQLKQEQQQLVQQKAEQLKLEQKKAEQQIAERQRADQAKLEQQRVEQAKLEQQRVEQQKAEQQRAEQQKAEQQKAEQAAAQRQQAERDAAQQRARDLAAAQPGIAGQGGPATGSGAGGGSGQVPKNMLGSDLGNRARELVKGLDLLRGAPPVARRAGDRRAVVSFNERDLPLKMYVDSWRQKIERNGALNYPRSWADAVRIDPLVSVAVRSDGTVEDVIIVQSSGRADMDEAVRRIVRVNARYSPFPPQIAERYDVIVIRRVWRFDDALKLMEELH